LFPRIVRLKGGGRIKIVDQRPLIFFADGLDANDRVRRFLSRYRGRSLTTAGRRSAAA
jgi:hypothetical protein